MKQAAKKPIEPRDDGPSRRQVLASNPLKSHWVGASAGTGKTKVLIDRVLRLMLPRPGLPAESASAPERILCLTFTKTAAAEMSNRVYDILSAWAVMEDTELDEKLRDLTGEYPSKAVHDAARRLFARVLDTAGGLKIMTIHGFCQSVLKRFPVEAGLPPHFGLMDERAASEYLRQCLRDIIDGGHSPSFALLAKHLDPDSMSDLMAKIAARRGLLAEILKTHGGAEKTVQALYALLHVDENETEEDILESAGNMFGSEEAGVRRALDAMLQGSDTDKKRAAFMQPWLESKQRRTALFESYCKAFFTGDGKVFANLATKKAEGTFPDVKAVMQEEAERLQGVRDHLRAVKLAALNKALIVLAADMRGRYETHKRYTAQLDYDDLIIHASELLSDSRMVQWVLYKLDEGIDHILVDEAQDTSPDQWRVIRSLSSEFFAGRGIRGDEARTLFIVGDEKQSIFSFQGADPAAFAAMQDFFGEKARALQEGWEILLEHSFRSARAVLETVDSVFNSPAARQGVAHDSARAVRHLPFRTGQAGISEIWPLVRALAAEDDAPWAVPSAVAAGGNAAGMLARKIAGTIRGWLDSKEILSSKNRPIRAGDILVLVQSRGAFVELLTRALKEAQVPVAGVDRMNLTEEICVMDLLAAARFALQPRDDLTLAAVLKSPLVGMTEEELFGLCYGRPSSLWAAVQDKKPAIAALLSGWIERAGAATPYAFFAGILNTPCAADTVSGRRAFYGRLGTGVHDALDEFLNRCLHYAQMNAPALQKFVGWFMEGEAEIKREQEGPQQDQVRIMTVHGAKGLQAPVVFLPDSARKAHDHNRGRIRLHWPEDATGVPLWAPRQEFETPVYAARAEAARVRQEEEYRRLLYVALTRAEDRLYICGWRGRNAPKEDCWHGLVSGAFPPQAVEEDFFIGDMPVTDEDGAPLKLRRLSNPQEAPPEKDKSVAALAAPRHPLPDFARRNPAPEPLIGRPLAPSRPDDPEPAAKGPLDEGYEWKFRRGTLVHGVLEVLPQLPEDRRREALAAYLARPGLEIPPEQQGDLAAEIMAVLEHPDFRDIFGPGSQAEVPVTGIVGATAPQVLSGQIDRLLITEKDVLIVDYKTNRPPPLKPESAPRVYLKQMAAYRAVMQKIYPGRKVRAALLWTDGPRLMPLPDALLDSYAP